MQCVHMCTSSAAQCTQAPSCCCYAISYQLRVDCACLGVERRRGMVHSPRLHGGSSTSAASSALPAHACTFGCILCSHGGGIAGRGRACWALQACAHGCMRASACLPAHCKRAQTHLAACAGTGGGARTRAPRGLHAAPLAVSPCRVSPPAPTRALSRRVGPAGGASTGCGCCCFVWPPPMAHCCIVAI